LLVARFAAVGWHGQRPGRSAKVCKEFDEVFVWHKMVNHFDHA
jgi:hypothetical protein